MGSYTSKKINEHVYNDLSTGLINTLLSTRNSLNGHQRNDSIKYGASKTMEYYMVSKMIIYDYACLLTIHV